MLRSSLQFRALTLLSRQPMQLRSSAHRMASTATPPANSTAVEHDEKNKQFRYLGGHLDYELYKEKVNAVDISVMDLTHTFVPPSGRGKGIAKILCDEAFQFARQNELAIRPSCTYISQTYIVKYESDRVQIV